MTLDFPVQPAILLDELLYLLINWFLDISPSLCITVTKHQIAMLPVVSLFLHKSNERNSHTKVLVINVFCHSSYFQDMKNDIINGGILGMVILFWRVMHLA